MCLLCRAWRCAVGVVPRGIGIEIGGGGGADVVAVSVAVAVGRVVCWSLGFSMWVFGDCGVDGVAVLEALLVFACRAVFRGDLNGLLRASSSRRRLEGCVADMMWT